MHFVYMIRNSSRKLYVGISADPQRRLAEHNNGRGANYTKNSSYDIVFLEQYETLAAACAREIQIKKWRRSKKDALAERYKKGLETKISEYGSDT